ncbi:hypothetical protein ACLKA7_004657 [Drosophila subpalustris]
MGKERWMRINAYKVDSPQQQQQQQPLGSRCNMWQRCQLLYTTTTQKRNKQASSSARQQVQQHGQRIQGEE